MTSPLLRRETRSLADVEAANAVRDEIAGLYLLAMRHGADVAKVDLSRFTAREIEEHSNAALYQARDAFLEEQPEPGK